MNLCVSGEYAVLAAKAIAMAVLSEKLHSQYFQHQDNTAKGRYLEKLQILGNIEYPYVWCLRNKCRVVRLAERRVS